MYRKEIFKAIVKNNIKELEKYIIQGFDINAKTEKEQWTYLHHSLINGMLHPNTEIILKLGEFGIDVNALDIYGNTALHYAPRSKKTEIVQVLLSLGADVNILNLDTISPLQQQFMMNPPNYNAVLLLLNAGAFINRKVDGNITFIEYKKRVNNPILNELLEKFIS